MTKLNKQVPRLRLGTTEWIVVPFGARDLLLLST